MGIEDDVFGKSLNRIDINPNNQRSYHVNDLIQRLELPELETKAGHDGFYDEMLDIYKQPLSMKIMNQEQLDNFVLNYGK